jgi:hypothetical protein|tara:strand:+ start:98 stop:217 length:120 start_codon:yes stop_codon:yes gene_type:complete
MDADDSVFQLTAGCLLASPITITNQYATRNSYSHNYVAC